MPTTKKGLSRRSRRRTKPECLRRVPFLCVNRRRKRPSEPGALWRRNWLVVLRIAALVGRSSQQVCSMFMIFAGIPIWWRALNRAVQSLESNAFFKSKKYDIMAFHLYRMSFCYPISAAHRYSVYAWVLPEAALTSIFSANLTHQVSRSFLRIIVTWCCRCCSILHTVRVDGFATCLSRDPVCLMYVRSSAGGETHWPSASSAHHHFLWNAWSMSAVEETSH